MTEKLRRLHEAATPGPWQAGIPDMIHYNDGEGNIGEIWSSRTNPETHIQCDAELITYMRNHAEHFLALIEAARKLPSAKELYEDYGCTKHALPQFYILAEALKPFDGE